MKKLLMLSFLTLVLNACGNKGGNTVDPNSKISNTRCVFSALSIEQIRSIQSEMINHIKQKFGNEACNTKRIYQNLSTDLVFQILQYNSNADILGAIESEDLVGFITTIFDEPSCQFVLMNPDEINLAKQCKWEK